MDSRGDRSVEKILALLVHLWNLFEKRSFAVELMDEEQLMGRQIWHGG